MPCPLPIICYILLENAHSTPHTKHYETWTNFQKSQQAKACQTRKIPTKADDLFTDRDQSAKRWSRKPNQNWYHGHSGEPRSEEKLPIRLCLME